MGIFEFAPWGNVFLKEGAEYVPLKDMNEVSLSSNEAWGQLYYCADVDTGKFQTFMEHEFVPESASKTEKHVFYPGTHDNETLVGWFESEDRTELEKKLLIQYLEHNLGVRYYQDKDVEIYFTDPIHWKVIRILAASEDIKYSVVQMQDILGLPNEKDSIKIRTNQPNQKGQWQWKLGGEQNFTPEIRKKLRQVTELTGRI